MTAWLWPLACAYLAVGALVAALVVVVRARADVRRVLADNPQLVERLVMVGAALVIFAFDALLWPMRVEELARKRDANP